MTHRHNKLAGYLLCLGFYFRPDFELEMTRFPYSYV